MKKIKGILTALAIGSFSAALLAGCSVGEPSIQDKIDALGLKGSVTYYANGGTFDGTQNLFTKEILYQEGAPVIEIGKDGVQLSVARSGYVFAGWYYCKLDGDGKPVLSDGDRGVAEATATPMTFPYKIQADEHLYLCASWAEDVRLEYVLAGIDSITAKDGTKYQKGDVIKFTPYGNSNSVTVNDSSPLEASDATYLMFYSDEACTRPFTGAVEKPEDGSNAKIYVKYLQGQWTVVKTARQVSAMFGEMNGDKNYYIANDIDCSTASVKFSLKRDIEFTGTIQGNGYTISNIKVVQTGIAATTKYSLLGSVGAGAKIEGLTLENIELDLTVRTGGGAIAGVFSSIGEGAAISGFAVKDLKLKLNLAQSVNLTNIPAKEDGTFSDESYLFGGDMTDEQYAEKYGIEIGGCELAVTK